VAAEKDLAFGLNYRYLARHRLDGPPVLLGRDGAEGQGRRCRFCEQAGPAVSFSEPEALPDLPGGSALRAWDECDDCRDAYESTLAGAFPAFAGPMLGPTPALPPDEIPIAALKELFRLGLAVLPPAELHHFGDTIEWVTNPDHDRDALVLPDLGCHVYLTPGPVSAPFVALARRIDDEAPWPYLLVFLAADRVVFQTQMPLCTRDEDLEDAGPRGPRLSMSMGTGPDCRESFCTYLPAARPSPGPARAGFATVNGAGRV
ncbi:MAG: hypothetical protein LC745_05790, partial [Planctomycetia bacterium]|nr:hypothetical protein [Planctomycetia bacterium]